MSSDNDEADDMLLMMSCASCGIAEAEEIKLLKECTACDLVRYCSDECQEKHTTQHEEACKKRALEELRDELLFKQPESTHLGDCPICCLPLPLDTTTSTIQTCCSKVICDGCFHANYMREFEERLENRCPFCRKDLPKTYEECDKQRMKRVEANDPVAMYEEGFNLFKKGNYSSAFGYWMKAAEVGDAAAHYRLSCMYHNGDGVEKDGEKEMIVEKDCEKEVHHLEEAAIGGHPRARHNLGYHEWRNGNTERAVKHWIIAAAQGHDGSIKALMYEFRRGFVSKDDLAAALRAHQAAVDATKSPQREAAEAAQKKYRK